jgi:hypothetical protein
MASTKKKKKAGVTATPPVPPPPAAPRVAAAAGDEELWQANNVACQTLYSVLTLLAQIPKTAFFKPLGTRRMKSLAYLLPDGSSQIAAGRAHMMALQFDTMFLHFGATYQDSTQQAAVAAMQTVLGDGERTVAHLAAAADRHYLFWKEGVA